MVPLIRFTPVYTAALVVFAPFTITLALLTLGPLYWICSAIAPPVHASAGGCTQGVLPTSKLQLDGGDVGVCVAVAVIVGVRVGVVVGVDVGVLVGVCVGVWVGVSVG